MSDDESSSKLAAKVSRETVKKLTGEKRTSSFRAIYKAGELLDILCTPIAPTNELPHFDKELDDALLRRIITIPHPHVFKAEERVKDIGDKLLVEKDAIFSLIINELFKYIQEGLVKIPCHWTTSQSELLAGPTLYAFISETYKKTDGSTPFLRTSFKEIEIDYIAWCRISDVLVETRIAPGGLDDMGYRIDVERLKWPEAQKLHKAFKAMGYVEKIYHGAPYIWCTK